MRAFVKRVQRALISRRDCPDEIHPVLLGYRSPRLVGIEEVVKGGPLRLQVAPLDALQDSWAGMLPSTTIRGNAHGAPSSIAGRRAQPAAPPPVWVAVGFAVVLRHSACQTVKH